MRAAMIGSQTQLRLRRLDDKLDRLSGAVLTVMANEIDERHDLTRAMPQRRCLGTSSTPEGDVRVISAGERTPDSPIRFASPHDRAAL